MPKKLERCVKKVSKEKGKEAAWPICKASMNKSAGRPAAPRRNNRRGR